MADTEAYKNTSLSFAERARDLVSRMTLEEKISQMVHEAPAIDRLGVPAYNWWNECLHGVARAGVATVFPQAIGLAAMWDATLMHTIATAISDEGRAKHHEAVRQGKRGIYEGLTFWTPNINIFRDPRWGRGHETYGEDPYLTGRLGVAFVKGIQGDDPKYLKAVATPKHFAAHSGPEKDRHSFDAHVSPKDMRETYLPAFEACVREGKAESVMGAYNRTNGEPCCASKTLLQKILREEWGFQGYVVSDCGAIQDIHQNHHVTTCTAESAALSVTNGCDLECGCVYANLLTAVQKGLIKEEIIDKSLVRLFTARFGLGMFDPPENVRYAQISYDVNDCAEHRQLAKQAALESIVLLKNARNRRERISPSPGGEGRGEGAPLLPLSKSLGSIAVIGPNADSLEVLLGNYNGTPSSYVTPLAGIKAAVSPTTEVIHAKGCELLGKSTDGIAEAVAAAEKAEAVVMCLGLSPQIEGEAGDAFNSDAGGDRTHMNFTGVQQQLLEAVVAVGKPVVLMLISGSAMSITWAAEHVDAILQAWYPGEEGGTAIAEVLFGDYNPSGRLPITFYKSLDDLPPFADYAMKGRTYRYFQGEPLFAFGQGLSYTQFDYSDLKIGAKHGLELAVYLRTELTRAQTDAIAAKVKQLPGVLSVAVLSKDDEWARFKKANPSIASVSLPNPLPYSLRVRACDPTQVEVVASRIRRMKGVHRVCDARGAVGSTLVIKNAPADLTVSVTVTNTGDRHGEEVVQLYLSDLKASVPVPARQLVGFQRVCLMPREKSRVSFTITSDQMKLVNDHGERVLEPGEFRVEIGGWAGKPKLTAEFGVIG